MAARLIGCLIVLLLLLLVDGKQEDVYPVSEEIQIDDLTPPQLETFCRTHGHKEACWNRRRGTPNTSSSELFLQLLRLRVRKTEDTGKN